MMTKISPEHSSESELLNSEEGKIKVFKNRINGWYLDWSDSLAFTEHAGFASLHIAFGYFEMIYSYITGKSSNGKSKEFFEKGFL